MNAQIFPIILIIIVVALAIVKTLEENKRYAKQGNKKYKTIITIPRYRSIKTKDFTNQYQKRNLLTRPEFIAWTRLTEFANENNLIVCTKVRLLDLIEPKYTPSSGHNYALYKIQAKHIDFIICDQQMNVLVALELDDSSHNAPDRIERDIFVNQVLKNTGYKLIRTQYITNDDLDLIASMVPGTYWCNHNTETEDYRDAGTGDFSEEEPEQPETTEYQE